jgi:HD-GYP domain-containing protein (c-di-GMP phosphodiesterase class II)
MKEQTPGSPNGTRPERRDHTGAMENLLMFDGRDEIEELESIDESPEGESAEVQPAPASSLLSEAGAQSVIRSYDQIPEPFALLDEGLGFLFRNKSFKELIKAFGYPETQSFLNTLSRSINTETARSIRESLGHEEKGHAWKGTISHKTKNAAAVITKVHIFPYYSEEREEQPASGKPEAYSVYLDDVTEENKKFLHDMFSSLLEASKLKDNDTGKHIERVNCYASIIAKDMFSNPRWTEVDKDFVENIGFLAAMHDVGKIGTPDDILNKEGPLNEFEWGIMKEHTKNGAFILSSYPNPMAKEIALSHYEWWNGSGYPYNLEGTMIPLSARIVTIADVYDALRMKRSYKPAYSHEIAIRKIKQEREVHFDPELVDLVLSIQEDFAEIYLANAD